MARKLLILTAILMAFAAAAVYFYFVIGPAGKRVFAEVRVGDSEQHLVSLLDGYGVEYHKQTDAKKTTYTHEGRFLDLCYYTVVDGRVIDVGMD